MPLRPTTYADIEGTLAGLPGAKRDGAGWRVPCPVHNGEDANLHVWPRDDGTTGRGVPLPRLPVWRATAGGRGAGRYPAGIPLSNRHTASNGQRADGLPVRSARRRIPALTGARCGNAPVRPLWVPRPIATSHSIAACGVMMPGCQRRSRGYRLTRYPLAVRGYTVN